ncbi:MAG TPA: hypothetical protein VMA71_07540 [Alloacidobacterium sp.]|nr:hypothetical protein [Alloacidobacterium sp.]
MNGKSETRLTPKNWATRVEAESWRLRNIVLVFLLCAFGFLLLTTMGVYFLQGFRVYGFYLPANVLLWLGGATIGEVAGLLILCIRAVFVDPKPGKGVSRKARSSEPGMRKSAAHLKDIL